jgi:hypothetical protein
MVLRLVPGRGMADKRINVGKLVEMPEQAIIDGFKGVVDFYYWMGIPVFRAWPKNNLKHRSPGVQSTWPAFAYASREWSNLSKTMQDAYKKLATNSGLSGRDMFTRGYLTGLYRYPLP